MQREPTQCSWTPGEMLSGLWHQMQFSGQPLKKTVLLIPGPSSVDIRWMRRMVAVVSFSFSSLHLASGFPPFRILTYSASWLIRAMSSFCSSLPTLVK